MLFSTSSPPNSPQAMHQKLDDDVSLDGVSVARKTTASTSAERTIPTRRAPISPLAPSIPGPGSPGHALEHSASGALRFRRRPLRPHGEQQRLWRERLHEVEACAITEAEPDHGGTVRKHRRRYDVRHTLSPK